LIELDIKLLASTQPGKFLNIPEAIEFSGRMAGICYMPDSYEAIQDEPEDKTTKRANMVLRSGHHSVFDHVSYNLLLENVPKMLVMVLNNEKAYTTSEKSARYTQMEPSERERKLYDKWLKIFTKRIMKVYPDTLPEKAKKLAQENARYLISVFTPTTLAYTASLRQWNYIIYEFKKFIVGHNMGKTQLEQEFFQKLKDYMGEFLKLVEFLYVPMLDNEAKDGSLSMFDTRSSYRSDHFEETYCTSYVGSFAQLAQAQRHRTIDYKMSFLTGGSVQCYLPPILTQASRVKYEKKQIFANLAIEWYKDFSSLSDVFPQGMLVKICERGTYEDFILKTKERLCSNAQLEISRQTWATFEEYLDCLGDTDSDELRAIFLSRDCGARCGAGYKCISPCKWGKKQQDRLI
jgi:hypothetical protein